MLNAESLLNAESVSPILLSCILRVAQLSSSVRRPSLSLSMRFGGFPQAAGLPSEPLSPKLAAAAAVAPVQSEAVKKKRHHKRRKIEADGAPQVCWLACFSSLEGCWTKRTAIADAA